MSGKIDISRELATEILQILLLDEWMQASPLAVLLAAPAVERQEPIAYCYKEYVWATGLCAHVWRDKLETERPSTDDNEIKDLVPLYAEQPAPVAVVLPERRTPKDYNGYIPSYASEAAAIWNACLDKVKELNQ